MLGILLSWISHNEVRVYFTPHFLVEYANRPDLISGIYAFYASWYIDVFFLYGGFLMTIGAAIMHQYTSLKKGQWKRLLIEMCVLSVLAFLPVVLTPYLI